jgi:hypothetical protein
MPVFYYSATFDESIGILRDLCKHGFRIIPARTYDQPTATEYDHVTNELLKDLREGPGFALTGAFTSLPVRLMRLDTGPATGKYVVDSLTQGPVLEGLLARINLVDGVPTTLLGYLSYQPQYKNPETEQWNKTSRETKGAYKSAVSIMKKSLVKSDSAKLPIGAEALRLVQEGKARLREHFGT